MRGIWDEEIRGESAPVGFRIGTNKLTREDRERENWVIFGIFECGGDFSFVFSMIRHRFDNCFFIGVAECFLISDMFRHQANAI